MNKKDRQEIKDIFNAKIKSLTECAGHLALDRIGEESQETRDWIDEELERLFWDIIRLQDLRGEMLNIGVKKWKLKI